MDSLGFPRGLLVLRETGRWSLVRDRLRTSGLEGLLVDSRIGGQFPAIRQWSKGRLFLGRRIVPFLIANEINPGFPRDPS
jgi:hypothetical protein